jgi:hypothetical protein
MFSIIKSREIPYLSTSLTEELEANRHEMTSTMNLRYDNLLKEGAHWQSNDLVIRMSFFFRRRIQKLCKNTVRIYMYKLMSRYFTLLYAALRYSTQLYATLRYSTLLYATLRYSTLLYATLRYATISKKIGVYFCSSHDLRGWIKISIAVGSITTTPI